MILALETSTASCSAALFSPERVLLGERLHTGGPAHTQLLLPAIHELLAGAGASAADVDCVVAGLGPGAYTGMRIGIATARAFAQAAGDTPAACAGVPTLTALALALADLHRDHETFLPLIDGRRGEVFAAVYTRAGGGISLANPLAVVAGGELAAYAAALPGAVAGGDGAHLYAAALPAAVTLSAAITDSTAAFAGRAYLAGAPGVVHGLANLLPLYGREPDAVRWHARKAAAR
jgi:tRNA threonylcarbamoyladenosine biosynthesis protein TsaB